VAHAIAPGVGAAIRHVLTRAVITDTSSRPLRVRPDRRDYRRDDRQHQRSADEADACLAQDCLPRVARTIADSRYRLLQQPGLAYLAKRQPDGILPKRAAIIGRHACQVLGGCLPVTMTPHERGGLVEAVGTMGLPVIDQNIPLNSGDHQSVLARWWQRLIKVSLWPPLTSHHSPHPPPESPLGFPPDTGAAG